MTREQATEAFNKLFDAGFDVELCARHDRKGLVTEAFPLRCVLRPLNREQLDKLTAVLEPLELDFSADSLRNVFAGGVTVNIFPAGARSYAA